MMGELTDAELSFAEEKLRAVVEQGRDVFLGDPVLVADIIAELRRFRSGELVQIPKSLDHARAMHLIAERYINDNAKG